jgi:hypothetical protein
MRMDRFNSDPALCVIALVSLKVPSCGIILRPRRFLLGFRSSERYPVCLRLAVGFCALFRLPNAPEIHNIRHQRDVYFRLRQAKRSATKSA